MYWEDGAMMTGWGGLFFVSLDVTDTRDGAAV
jgi:hypothetical protein